MTDIATIGFKVETKSLDGAETKLRKIGTVGKDLEKDIQKSFGSMVKQFSKLQQEISDTTDFFKWFTKETNDARESVKKLNTVLGTTVTKFGNLNKKSNNLKTSLGTLTDRYNKLNDQTEKYGRSLSMIDQKLAILNDNFKEQRTHVNGLTRDMVNAERASERTSSGMKDTADSGGLLSRSMDRVALSFQNVVAGFAVFSAFGMVRDIVRMNDEWDNLNSQIRLLTGSQEELIDVQQRLVSLSKDTRTGLDATVKLYTTLQRSTTELGLTQRDLMEQTKTINQLFLISGRPVKEVNAAMIQLTQGLAAGALRGDEFNSVAENAPRIMDALALKLKMTRGELREFAATGGITAEIMTQAIEDYGLTADIAASKVEKTFGQQLAIARTNVLEAVGANGQLDKVMKTLGKTVVMLSENLDALIWSLGAAGLGYAVGSFIIAAKGAITITASLSAAMATLAISAAPVLLALGAAAAAFAYFKSQNEEAKESVENLNKALDTQIKRFEDFNNQQKGEQYATLINRSNAARIELAKLEKQTEATYEAEQKRIKAIAEQKKIISDSEMQMKAINTLFEDNMKSMGANTSLWSEAVDSSLSSFGDLYNQINNVSLAIDKNGDITQQVSDIQDEFFGIVADNSKEFEQYPILLDILQLRLGILTEKTDEATDAIERENEEIDKWIETAEQWEKQAIRNAASISTSLSAQAMALTHGADAARLFAFEQSIAGNVLEKSKKKLTDQYKSLLLLTKQLKDAEKAQEDFNETLNDISSISDKLSQGFSGFGADIFKSFSQATGALSDYHNKMVEIFETQKIINQEKEAGIDVTAKQASLDSETAQANLNAIGSVLGASKNLFKEQSKERKILHALEMGFMAAEMALALEKAIVNGTNAILNQGTGDPYTAFARIAAMTAVVAGILGGIGAAVSSSGGGSAPIGPAGTGTTLGDSDAQSESISNGLELFEDIQIDQLAELRGIRSSMSDLAGGINQLTRSILGAGGIDTGFVSGLGQSGGFNSNGLSGPLGAGAVGAGVAAFTGGAALLSGGLSIVATGILDAITGGLVSDLLDGLIGGIFGKTKRKITDEGIRILSQSFTDILDNGELEAEVFAVVETTKKKLFGLIKNESSDTFTNEIDSEFSQQLGAIFGSMGESLLEAADLLNMDVSQALANFNIPELDISFTDKTGEEIEKELQAAIGSIGDQLASDLFPTLLQYQQINEGMFETVLRVTKETVIFEDALEKIAQDLDIGGESLIAFGQRVIDAMGGLDNFNESFSNFYENFYTEQERFLHLQDSLKEIFRDMNVELPMTGESFRTLVEETAALGEEGADTLAVLLELSPAMAEFTEQVKELSDSFRASMTAFASFSDFITILEANTTGNLFGGLGDISRVDTDALVEQFGSIESFMSVVLGFSNRFLSDTRSLEVQQATLMSSLSTLDEQFDLSDNLQNYISRLFGAIGSSADASLDDIAAIENLFESALTLGVNNADLQSGAFEALLSLQPGVESLLDRLTNMRTEIQAAAEAEAALQEERNSRTLDLQIQLLRTQGHELEAVALERAREIEVLQEYDSQNQTNLANLQSLIYLQEDYNRSLEEQQSLLQNTFDSLGSAVEAQRNALEQTILGLESLQTSIQSALRRQQVTTFGGMIVAMRELDAAISSARTGDFSGASNLDFSTLTAGDTSSFSSSADFNLSQAVITSKLEELADLTSGQISEEQQTLDTLNLLYENAQSQFNTLMGIQENQVQQLIDDGDYAAALDLAFANFLHEAINTNGLLALQNNDMTENFQALLDYQQQLIDSGNLNIETLVNITSDGNGLLSQVIGELGLTTDTIVGALDSTVDSILNLADIQQALIDANLVNFESLIALTDTQRHQIIDHLNGLTATTANLDVDMVSQLNRTNALLERLNQTVLEGAGSSFDFDYFMQIFKDHYTVTALNMGHNMRIADILSNSTPSGSSTNPWTTTTINRLLSHQADIDFNSHMASARVRIGNSQLESMNKQLTKLNNTVRELANNNYHQNQTIVNNTGKTANTLQRVERDGIDVRVEE